MLQTLTLCVAFIAFGMGEAVDASPTSGRVRNLAVDLVKDLNSDGLASPGAAADGNFDAPQFPELGAGVFPGELLPSAGKWMSAPGEAAVRFLSPGKLDGVPNHFVCQGQSFRMYPARAGQHRLYAFCRRRSALMHRGR